MHIKEKIKLAKRIKFERILRQDAKGAFRISVPRKKAQIKSGQKYEIVLKEVIQDETKK